MKTSDTATAHATGADQLASRRSTYREALKDLARNRPDTDGPKHAELTACIREAIRTGIFKPGDRLPTELELVELTPYSLGTVQRAIRSLVDSGLIKRQPRLGTFVSDKRQQINEPWHFCFLDSDNRTRLPVFPRIVSRHRTAQRGPWSGFLQQGDGDIIRIERLVNVNDELLAFSRFFVLASRFSRFLDFPLKLLHGANFRVLLDKEFGAHASRISHRVAIGEPAANICKQIRVPAGTRCLKVDILAASMGSEPIYYQELTVPPSDRKLDLAEGLVGQ